MSETLQIWLFGIFGAWCVALTIALLHVLLFQERMRGLLISINKQAADFLHRDDDAHGMDYYLDLYRKHHHDMPDKDWVKMMELVTKLKDNPEARTEEQMVASLFLLIELCLHKKARSLPSQEL